MNFGKHLARIRVTPFSVEMLLANITSHNFTELGVHAAGEIYVQSA